MFSGSIWDLTGRRILKLIFSEFQMSISAGLSGTYHGKSSPKYVLHFMFIRFYLVPIRGYVNRNPFLLSSERASIRVYPVPIRENHHRNIHFPTFYVYPGLSGIYSELRKQKSISSKFRESIYPSLSGTCHGESSLKYNKLSSTFSSRRKLKLTFSKFLKGVYPGQSGTYLGESSPKYKLSYILCLSGSTYYLFGVT